MSEKDPLDFTGTELVLEGSANDTTPTENPPPAPVEGKIEEEVQEEEDDDDDKMRKFFVALPPEKFIIPSVGGVYLREFPEWERIRVDLQAHLLNMVLSFAAQEPRPPRVIFQKLLEELENETKKLKVPFNPHEALADSQEKEPPPKGTLSFLKRADKHGIAVMELKQRAHECIRGAQTNYEIWKVKKKLERWTKRSGVIRKPELNKPEAKGKASGEGEND